MTTTCILLCGGDNSRWGGYRNAPRKHLVDVEEEILLHRTLRMIEARACDRTVVVVNRDDVGLYASALSVPHEFHGIVPASPRHTEAYKFLSSRELWNPAGRTIVLMGDVWFSEEAMTTIFESPSGDWTAFGRAGASRFTGRPYGELFAQRFTASQEHEEKLADLDAQYRAGTCRRAASGWAHYHLMIGVDPNVHAVGPRFVEIDDFTDDFDCPSDYDAWVFRRAFQGIEERQGLFHRSWAPLPAGATEVMTGGL